jgi:Ca2+-dependent lipid-binding protein
LIVKVIHARGIKKADRNGSDPYAIIKFPNTKGPIEKKTSVKSSTLNPVWSETFKENIIVS